MNALKLDYTDCKVFGKQYWLILRYGHAIGKEDANECCVTRSWVCYSAPGKNSVAVHLVKNTSNVLVLAKKTYPLHQ